MQWVVGALAHANNMSQADLARALTKRLRHTIDRAAVSKMTKGKRDVSAQEMLAIEEITGFPAPVEMITKLTTVPLISWVSAGPLSDPQSQTGAQEADKYLYLTDLGKGDFFALQVDGDSMNRVSPPGSVIVVNRLDRDLVADRYYVFMERGETTYKRWQPEPARLEPWSTNETHKPKYIKGKRDFEVVGRVRRTVLDL